MPAGPAERKQNMRQLLRKLAVVGAAGGLAGAGLLVAPAVSHPTLTPGAGCGQTVTGGTLTLTANIGPCASTAITVTGTNVTINLNGYDIIGTLDRTQFLETDHGPGILVKGARNVTITDSGFTGTVADGRVQDPTGTNAPRSEIYKFDAGVAIENSTNVTVKNLKIHTNGHGFSPAHYSDGVAIESSSGQTSYENIIENNWITNNGALSGVRMTEEAEDATLAGAGIVAPPGDTRDNTVRKNLIRDNNLCFTQVPPPPSPRQVSGTCQTIGVRLEPGVRDNTVQQNVISGSNLEGITVFFGNAALKGDSTNNNRIYSNVVEGNGFHNRTHRKGEGIRNFGTLTASSRLTDIDNNRVCGNAASGVRVDSPGNIKVHFNKVGDGSTTNPVNPTVALPACADNHVAGVLNTFDLHDSTAQAAPANSNTTNCGNLAAPTTTNDWHGNSYRSGDASAFNNACTTKAAGHAAHR